MEAAMEIIMEEAEFIPFVDESQLSMDSRVYLWMKAVSDSRENAEYEELNGKKYLVLHRDYKNELTYTCSFCGKKHNHDWDDGLKNAACSHAFGDAFANLLGERAVFCTRDGTILRAADGYIVRSRSHSQKM